MQSPKDLQLSAPGTILHTVLYNGCELREHTPVCTNSFHLLSVGMQEEHPSDIKVARRFCLAL